MFSHPHVYDLSFVSGNRKEKKAPQLLFTLSLSQYEKVLGLLNRVIAVNCDHARHYLSEDVPFALPVPDIFGNMEFGYGSCGVGVFLDTEVQLCLDIEKSTLPRVVLTINVLLSAFQLSLYEEVPSNRTQMVSLFTSCQEDMHGHYIGGTVSPQFLQFLRAQGKKAEEGSGQTPMPEEVIVAMRETWSVVGEKEFSPKLCRGYITTNGRFILVCPGDACDIAIYPDSVYGEDYGAQMSCHNLDTAAQQITFLCGFARLCELVQKEINRGE